MIIKNKFSFLLLLALVLGFAACEETKYDIESYTGESFIRFNGTSFNGFETDASAIEIPVVFSDPDGGSGSVDFQITGGTPGVDYEVLNSGTTLTFDAGNSFTDYIRIQPINNNPNNPNDVVLDVVLSNAQSGVIGFPGPDNTNTAQVNVTIINFCGESMLEGTYDYVTTETFCGDAPAGIGSVDIIALGDGRYTFSEWSFGAYEICYNGFLPADWGTLTLVEDVCSRKLSYEGTDAYGDTWFIESLTVDGSDMTIEWLNTYDEGGTTTLTRTDGSSWPDLTI